MKKKIVIYGIGGFYKNNKCFLPAETEIVAYCDKYRAGEEFGGVRCLRPEALLELSYDEVYICLDYGASGSVYEELVGLGVEKNKIRFLNRLRARENWSYSIDTSGTMVSKIDDVKIQEKSKNDRGVLNEIFARNTYGIRIKPNTVVVDFGMNIGAASLYFAANENTIRVYGFEPFPDTYRMAIENIEMNKPKIRNKIRTYNIAISDFDEERDIPVSTEFSGGRTTELNYLEQYKGNRTEHIVYKRATEILTKIIEENYGTHILLKIDTEGSEFEIFHDILDSKIFERLDAIVMEYHRKPQELIDILETNGYRCIMEGDMHIGMIYAVNMNEVL